MDKKVIVITGTPGVGKSTAARALAQKLKLERLDISHYYRKIAVSYNRKKHCYDIDRRKFTALVQEKFRESKKGLIIDSHIAHLLPKRMVDLCIVLTCSNLKLLQKRLQERKYSSKKIKENLDAEIFQVCLAEAQENGQKVLVFDSCALKMNKIIAAINNYWKKCS